MEVILADHQKRSEQRGVTPSDLKAADAVWVATAMLHILYPEREGFSVHEIEVCVRDHQLTRCAQKTIYHHAKRHCVANLRPHSNRTRMLLELSGGDRRLFRLGDPYDAERRTAPSHPEWDELPPQYRYLQAWYESWTVKAPKATNDALLDLVGTWTYGGADEYVSSLREGWDDRP